MPQTVSDLTKPNTDYKINPIIYNDKMYKSILLFAILSLIADKNAFRKIDLKDIIGSSHPPPNTLKTKIKQCLNDIRKVNDIFSEIDEASVLPSLNINNDRFITYGKRYILSQLLLSSIYKYLNLSCLTIESFNNRNKTLIGFNNYIDFEKEITKGGIQLNNNKAHKELLKRDYSNDAISKLKNYPDFIIVNEWKDKNDIYTELYDIADDCDILNKETYNKNRISIFDNQEYKLISCISTNYTKSPDKEDKNKNHNVIYLIDETYNFNTYGNYIFKLEKKTTGFLYSATKIEDVKCDKIYKLKQDPKYSGYEYSFENNKCDINNSDYKVGGLNFSTKTGNRIFIYYRTGKSYLPQPAQPPVALPVVAPAVVAPPAEQPGTKTSQQSPPQVKSRDSIDNFVSIDNDFKKYLKEIKFKNYLNYIKKKINNYYYYSSRKLATKIVEDNNDEIYKENNDMMKDKIHGKIGNKDLLKATNINKISSSDKNYIAQKIEKDIKKQTKSLDMKIHIFLTMSFQLMISKIKSKAEKELNKMYKSEVKDELRKIKKAYNKHKHSSSASSFKSAIVAAASSPKPAPASSPKPASPKPLSPKPVGPAPGPPKPAHQFPHAGKKGKRRNR